MDNRLKFIAGLVSIGCSLADIGTDHAYLPIFLSANNICKKIIATDIRKKPLLVAKKNVEKSGAQNIELRLCDGLSGIKQNEVDEIVIAGMGGEVISGIISKAEWLNNSKYKLILQPMSHTEDLRKFLVSNGFSIEKEQAVISDNRIYSVMQVRFCNKKETLDDLFFYVGMLPCNLGEAEIKYINWRRKVLFERAQKIAKVNAKQIEYKHLLKIVKQIDELLGNEQKCH